MKIALLALSIILTFARTEFLVFGDLAIGGRMPVMELAGFEIVDTIIEMRKG